MKAEQARELAFKSNTQDDNGQMIEILSIIKKAAESGEYHCWYYDKVIINDVRTRLTELGYEVGASVSDRNELLTEISWHK